MGYPSAGALNEVVKLEGRFLALQLLVLVAAATAASASGSIIITQVLYDPINSESGGEAVELYNPMPNAIDISGWVISTETSRADVIFPEGAVIRSGSYYLVSDAGWSTGKDVASWPEADFEEAMTLANTDAGIALSSGSSVIDAVGWGTEANIGNGLYKGSPHIGVGSGESLARVKNGSSYADSGNNLADFAASIPSFRNSSYGNSYGSSEMAVVAVVQGSFPAINSVEILTDDDSAAAGSQINPEPKKNKTVEISAVVSHNNGNSYLNGVVMAVNGSRIQMASTALNSTSSLYRAEFNMSYYAAAGNYTITVIATDNSGFSANSSSNFEYTSLIAMEIDANSIQFAAMPGQSAEVIGDYDEATAANTTINNIGNTIVDIQLSGTNLSAGSSTIDVSNIQYTFNGAYNNSMAGALSHSKQTKQIAIRAASRQPVSFRLNVPTATAPGNYTGTITLLAVKP